TPQFSRARARRALRKSETLPFSLDVGDGVVMQLAGKTALVTGANSGIGLEACVKLARLVAELVIVARDEQKGAAAGADVKQRGGSENVSLLLCDFSSQAAIRKLAADYRARHA